ncbi:polysaccharide pyruvyl transferase family protein [Moorena sp. SIO4A5]|uniref:polysaccharide pyruvyl transferase family protein n=1 Tax=Moorena sp. SIO4A5 TaxID=2607838 RepID=UPI0013C57AEE|nr:polysaccharide pyruvyl transferase family protein [Moorena sp. SIO4A5]NEO22729.1 polysaccharide pyruvyl transferase family protein [Moorena sp. SIO4A5]
MKVGILTFHDGINHGAFLQAYCLQETVKMLGADVYIINYRSRFYHSQRYKQRHDFFIKSWKTYRHFSVIKVKWQNIIKNLRFKYAQQSNLNLTFFSHDISTIIEKYKFDLIILGSDEIWNFKNDSRGFDLNYFGKDLREIPTISYAPSLGQISLGDKIPNQINTYLKQLSSISVRDRNSLEILKSMALNATQVLDPTFLYDVQVINPHKIPKINKYILVYAGYISTENKQSIQDFSRRYGYKLVAASYDQNWCDYSFVDVGICEWLGLFKNASFIITNTFHGTIFSILNKKDFCVLDLRSKTNKISNLLEDLKLVDRIVYSSSEFNHKILERIDYNKVFDLIDKYKKQSLLFLETNINSI